MRAPERLKHDPELRQAFDNEDLAVGPFDLDGLRAKVVSGAPSAPPPSRWPQWLGLVGVSALTAALVSLALQPTPQTVVGPVVTPVLQEIRGLGTRLAEREQVLVVDEEPEPELLPRPLAAPNPIPIVMPPVVVAPSPSPPPVQGLAPTPSPNLLAEELAAYNPAVDAADKLRWTEARAHYELYLARWPNGRFRKEAQLGLLSALVQNRLAADAEALANRLLADPAFTTRTSDVLLLRAEALVELGRCDDALASIDELKRTPRVNALRTACRKLRR